MMPYKLRRDSRLDRLKVLARAHKQYSCLSFNHALVI
jgi:hypothetical protein